MKTWKAVYEGEENNGEENNQESNEENKPKSLKELIESDPKFQEELNGMMATNRKNLKKQNDDLIKQLENLRQNAQMTSQERDELESRIEELQNQFLTKEELAKKDKEKAQKEYTKKVDELSSERDKWANLYSTETVRRELQDAAIEGEAIHAEQIVDILGPKTHLSEAVDSTGQRTGKYQTIVKFTDVNSDGEPVVLELTPSDTIKRMKEIDKYHNLFKGTARGGLGGTAGGTSSITKESFKELLNDPAKYAKWRKENPDLDISKLRK